MDANSDPKQRGGNEMKCDWRGSALWRVDPRDAGLRTMDEGIYKQDEAAGRGRESSRSKGSEDGWLSSAVVFK